MAAAESNPMQDHVALIREALKKPGEPYVLNVAKDTDYRVVKSNFGNIGLTPERYPQMFNQLETARRLRNPREIPVLELDTDGDGYCDAIVVENMGTTSGGNACATGKRMAFDKMGSGTGASRRYSGRGAGRSCADKPEARSRTTRDKTAGFPYMSYPKYDKPPQMQGPPY